MTKSFPIEDSIRKRNVSYPSFNLEDKLENHHIVGKINSNLTIPLPKGWHKYISNWQNSQSPKDRSNRLSFFIESIAALLDLTSVLLRKLAFDLRGDEYELISKKLYETKSKK